MNKFALLTSASALAVLLGAPAFAQTEIATGANVTGVSGVNERLDDVRDALAGGSPAPAVAESFAAAEAGLRAGHVTKPIFSREGAGVIITQDGREIERTQDDTYDDHPRIIQGLARLPEFGGFYPVIGAWIVGQDCVGMGLREDASRITHNLSRFKPHFIEG